MASVNKDVADVDIHKPGFFHLCYNFDKNEQTDEKRTQYGFFKKRHELMIQTLKKHDVPLVQVPALNNAIAVCLFQMPGRELDAKVYLEDVMHQSETMGSNTLANLIHIYQNLENGDVIYTTEIADLQEKLRQCLTVDSPLEAARAMCERGFFYEYLLKKNEDQQALDQFEKALEFFKVGINNGGENGMAQNELFIWKYALVRAQINMFNFVERLHSMDPETKQELFEAFVDSFEKFYAYAPEDCVFYKSRAIMECLQRMTLLKDSLNTLPDFDAIMQRGILGEMWEDRLATMEEALSMSPNDSKIALILGKMYLRIEQHDEAERYLEMSLSLESGNNLDALSALLLTYSKKVKILEMEHRKVEAAQEYLLKAYEKGKNLDREVIPTSTTLEMASVCYHLAIDKTMQPWSVPKHKIKYMKDAIRYNQLALDTHFEQTHMRAYKQLGDCFWMIDQHGKAIEHIRRSLNYKDNLKPEHIIGNLKSLLDKASRFLNMRHVCDTKKNELLHDLAKDLQFVWDNIPQHDDIKFIKMCVNFAKYISQKNHYITTIFQEISNQNSENGKQLLDWYCKIIQENNLPAWLKTHCLRMQQDH